MSRIRMEPGSSSLSVERNFQRIENASEATLDVVSGREVGMVGALIVATTLARVDQVVANFTSGPLAGGCYIQAYARSLVGGAPNEIQLIVFSNVFVQSVIAQNVAWIATGEKILG